MLPRDRRRGVGGIATETTHARARCSSAGALAPIAVVALLFPSAGSEPYEPWALDLGPLPLSHRRHRAAALSRRPLGRRVLRARRHRLVRRAHRARRQRQPDGPVRRGPAPRVRTPRPPPADPRWHWRSRCSSGSGYPRSTASRSPTPIRRPTPRTTRPCSRISASRPGRRRHGRPSAGSRFRRRTGTGKPPTPRRTCCSRAAGNASSTSRTTRSSTRRRSPSGTYRMWLHANGVKYVALPDARLDDSSLGERALIERGLPYLQRGLARRALARVAGRRTSAVSSTVRRRWPSMSPDRVTLHVTGTDDLVRARARDESLVGETRRVRGRDRRRLDACCAACRAGRSHSRSRSRGTPCAD